MITPMDWMTALVAVITIVVAGLLVLLMARGDE